MTKRLLLLALLMPGMTVEAMDKHQTGSPEKRNPNYEANFANTPERQGWIVNWADLVSRGRFGELKDRLANAAELANIQQFSTEIHTVTGRTFMHDFIDNVIEVESNNATKKMKVAYECFIILMTKYKADIDTPDRNQKRTVRQIIMSTREGLLKKYKTYLATGEISNSNEGSKEPSPNTSSKEPSPSISPKETSPRKDGAGNVQGPSASSGSSSTSSTDQTSSTLLPPSTPAPQNKNTILSEILGGNPTKTPTVGKTPRAKRLLGQTYADFYLDVVADQNSPARFVNRVALKAHIECKEYAKALKILQDWNPAKLNEIRDAINKPKDNIHGHTVLHFLLLQMLADCQDDYVNPNAAELFSKIVSIEGVLTNIPDRTGLTVDMLIRSAPDAIKDALGRGKSKSAASSTNTDNKSSAESLIPPYSASASSTQSSSSCVSSSSSASSSTSTDVKIQKEKRSTRSDVGNTYGQRSDGTNPNNRPNGPVFPKKNSIGAGTVLGGASLLAALLAGTYYAKAQKQPVRAKNDNRPLSTKTEQAV